MRYGKEKTGAGDGAAALSSLEGWLLFDESFVALVDGGSIEGRSVEDLTTGSGREAKDSSPEEVSRVIWRAG
jgi:hypothetical protein